MIFGESTRILTAADFASGFSFHHFTYTDKVEFRSLGANNVGCPARSPPNFRSQVFISPVA